MTTVADGLFQYGGMPTFGMVPPFVGENTRVFFVDPVNGVDGNPGNSPQRALQSLYRAHELMTAGQNDVCYLIGNGQTSGTARLSTAAAQAIDSSATTGTLTWSKAACHLIGIAAPGPWARARISTPTGTYTQATFNALPMVTVSASGCYFANLSMFQQFSTGANGEICLNVTGNYNVFDNVAVLGIASAAAASGAASRSLTVNSGDDNLFQGCQIGTDTVTRSAANSNIEFLGAAARNRFLGCTLPIMTSAATATAILGTGNGCVDRFTLFKSCEFINAVSSTSTNMTAMGNFTTASPGGLVMLRDCALIGATKWGSANFLANSYVDNVGGAATDGLSLNPS